jgi:hypothetical protein
VDPVIGVVDEPVEALAGSGAVPDRLLEGVEGEVSAQRAGCLPADDAAGEHVGDERHVGEAGPGAHTCAAAFCAAR